MRDLGQLWAIIIYTCIVIRSTRKGNTSVHVMEWRSIEEQLKEYTNGTSATPHLDHLAVTMLQGMILVMICLWPQWECVWSVVLLGILCRS